MNKKIFFLENETDTVNFGRKLSVLIKAPMVIYLTGDLGTGKTTMSRGLIQHLGHQGAVKSPTYTLVEPYELNDIQVYHFDLYRLLDSEELEFMGIRDYFNNKSICIIEWPDRGQGILPPADLHIHLAYQEQSRTLNISAHSDKAETLLEQLQ